MTDARSAVSRMLSDRPDLRSATAAVASRAASLGWRTALLGGAVLDACLGASPRDLDFVLDAPTWWESVAGGLFDKRRVNAFGGTCGTVLGVPVDVWCLSGTSGFQDLGLTPSFPSLPRTSFFNVNAAAVEVLGDGSVGPAWDAGLAEGLASMRLEVVNPVNRFPALQAAVTMRLASRGFSVGDSLSAWLRASGVTLRSAERVYAERYGKPPAGMNAVSGLLAIRRSP